MNKKLIYLTLAFIITVGSLTAAYALASFTYTANLTVPGDNLQILNTDSQTLNDGTDLTYLFEWNTQNQRFELPLKLKNTGSTSISADIVFTDFPANWTYTSTPTQVPTISAGQVEDFTLIVIPPQDAVAGDSSGPWSFTITEKAVIL